MARLWVGVVLLLACRTPPLDPASATPDLGRVADLLARDMHTRDLAPPPDGGWRCSPAHPDGYCPPNTSCCPYSCWGGSEENGWCSPSQGCPLC